MHSTLEAILKWRHTMLMREYKDSLIVLYSILMLSAQNKASGMQGFKHIINGKNGQHMFYC